MKDDLIPQDDVLVAPSRELPSSPSSPQKMDGPTRRICSMKNVGVRSMRYTGKFAGAPVMITVDCGSEDNFIAKSATERLGLSKVDLIEPFDAELHRLEGATCFKKNRPTEWLSSRYVEKTTFRT